jgi:ABC-2 type transport system permease protein
VIRALASEWLRFRSRRIVRWLMLISVIGAALVAIIAGSVSHAPTDAQLALAQQRYEKSLADCIKHDGAGFEVPAGSSVKDVCRRNLSAADFVANESLQLDELDEYVLGAAFIVVLIGLVIGASMVGASWQSGTITTILTWEPRRIRWFLSRSLVIAVGVALVAAVLLAILAAALALATSLRGVTTTSSSWLSDTLLTILRIAAAAGGIAVIGGAVAMIGRHTAAALGAVFVYVAVLESIVRGLRPAMGRFLLGDNLTTVVTAHTLDVRQGTATYLLTPQHGAVVIGVYVIVLVGVALALLRARDVN